MQDLYKIDPRDLDDKLLSRLYDLFHKEIIRRFTFGMKPSSFGDNMDLSTGNFGVLQNPDRDQYPGHPKWDLSGGSKSDSLGKTIRGIPTQARYQNNSSGRKPVMNSQNFEVISNNSLDSETWNERMNKLSGSGRKTQKIWGVPVPDTNASFSNSKEGFGATSTYGTGYDRMPTSTRNTTRSTNRMDTNVYGFNDGFE